MGLPDLRVFFFFWGGDAGRRETWGSRFSPLSRRSSSKLPAAPNQHRSKGHIVSFMVAFIFESDLVRHGNSKFPLAPSNFKTKREQMGQSLKGCLRILCVVLIWPRLIPRPPLTCRTRCWSQTAICRSATAHVSTSLPCPSCREPCVLEKVQAILNAKPY